MRSRLGPEASTESNQSGGPWVQHLFHTSLRSLLLNNSVVEDLGACNVLFTQGGVMAIADSDDADLVLALTTGGPCSIFKKLCGALPQRVGIAVTHRAVSMDPTSTVSHERPQCFC